MSARTFAEWQAFYTLEQFGSQADFWQAGLIASMIANVYRKKNQKPFTPYDFMPKGMVETPETYSSDEHAVQRMRQNFMDYNTIQKENQR